MSQLSLQPAPDDWADGFQSLTRPPDVRIETESPLGLGGGLLMAALLRLVTWAVAGEWLPATLLGLGLTPLGYLALRQAQGKLFRAYRQLNAGIKASRGRGRAIVTTLFLLLGLLAGLTLVGFSVLVGSLVVQVLLYTLIPAAFVGSIPAALGRS